MPGSDVPIKRATRFGNNDYIALGAPAIESLVGKGMGEGDHGEVVTPKRILDHRVQVFVPEPVANTHEAAKSLSE